MSTQQSGLVAGNQQNVSGGNVPRNRSRFPLSKSFFTTERFADYNPCFVMEGVSGDKITLNQPHQVRTYTLKAPLMQDLLKKKDYFMVPMQAILPLNWEKFYTNPTIGDDVPDGVGLSVLNFWKRLNSILVSDFTTLHAYLVAAHTDVEYLTYIFKFLVFYEQFYSNGSLLKQLHNSGCAGISFYYDPSGGTSSYLDYDLFFDKVISYLVQQTYGIQFFTATVNGTSYTVYCNMEPDVLLDYTVAGGNKIGLRRFLELIREDLASMTITAVTAATGATWSADIESFTDDCTLNIVSQTSGSETPLNLARLWAYQIVCAHYYSNDHIDVVYSAELYREYIRNLFITCFSGSSISGLNVFTYNGMKYEWDALSAQTFIRMISGSTGAISSSTVFQSCFSMIASQFAYFSSLFGFKRSLRFMDYFTGSRSRPLAIGNEATIDTSGSNVSVLDVSRKFQMTRFYQAINRSGRKFSAYMKEMFGKVPAPDYHNPFYLAHCSDVVGGSETENTGAAQLTQANSITTILRSNAARYAFTFEPDRDCIIIGISYYDLPRVYTRATERQWFIKDRFDMFNPFLQYTGDQPIYRAELGVGSDDLVPFSYCNSDMEYKQMYNQAAGGFSVRGSQLRDWFFPAETLHRSSYNNIGSSFIRSFSSEFDRFYVSLTGWSLGNYWHFIVRYDDRCDASRPMAYAPGILQ